MIQCCLGCFIILVLFFMITHSPWFLITNHSIFLWNEIDSQKSWLYGILSYRSMILILSIRLVGLIEMLMT
jgi:hypothetical protein